MLKKLVRDAKLCVGCGECISALPNFLEKFGGVLPISGYRYKNDIDGTRTVVDLAICHCPVDALSLDDWS
jgi:ferredoxin